MLRVHAFCSFCRFFSCRPLRSGSKFEVFIFPFHSQRSDCIHCPPQFQPPLRRRCSCGTNCSPPLLLLFLYAAFTTTSLQISARGAVVRGLDWIYFFQFGYTVSLECFSRLYTSALGAFQVYLFLCFNVVKHYPIII